MAKSAVSSVSDASRPQLFGQLGPDVFTVFSGGNRLLYERAILAVYDDFYRSDLLFPTEAEVVGAIYNCITREPSPWKNVLGLDAPSIHRLHPEFQRVKLRQGDNPLAFNSARLKRR
ncbi:hypothetical protein [Mesorhizobium ventifaucium]|uniref:Uncharacterized protein n=1 Tax=Mesorhizobium ventifaucium TaxID=666020 RepID=A0ABM9DI76_9HYPH|nr:hypothetical protein [Mesorhizobium ventifaucium]CAH2395626.1 hypothetical protein MES4922_130052 [Mesorhizobium ventifaucium]